jgi:hypothetical protein
MLTPPAKLAIEIGLRLSASNEVNMAASEAQIAANRANALKSTGPKDTSKTRFNGIRHGLTATHVVLPWEHKEDLEAIVESFETHFQPIDDYERLQVKVAAEAYWRMERSKRVEANIYDTSATAEIVRSKTEDPKTLHAGNLEAIAFLKASHEMEKYRRYDAHLHKAYKEALARVEKLASLRTPEQAKEKPLPPEPPKEAESQQPRLLRSAIELPIPKNYKLTVAGRRLPEKLVPGTIKSGITTG